MLLSDIPACSAYVKADSTFGFAQKTLLVFLPHQSPSGKPECRR